MRKIFIPIVLIAVFIAWTDYRAMMTSSQIIEVTIVSVGDDPKGNGWRRIVVTLPDGKQHTIETLVPFFYRPGHKAFVGVSGRVLFLDIYDFVAPPG